MPTNPLIFLLPRDILIQILLLLPLEWIPVCKLVSKEFKNLIDDPKIFNRFRDTSLAFFHSKDIVYCVLRRECNKKINSKPPFTVNRLPIDWIRRWNIYKDGIHELLSEPSKGIACVVTKGGLLLFYNMLTGDSYTVTDVPLFLFSIILNKPIRFIIRDSPLTRYCNSVWLCYGFGYDSYAGDCKMMLVFKRDKHWIKWTLERGVDINTVQNEDNSLYWVYSLRNRAWKTFKGFPYAAYDWIYSARRHCSFNGVLHWVVTTRGMGQAINRNRVILTYDLHTCRFGEMSMPTVHHPSDLGCAVVLELGGQLCCSTHRSMLTVWMMREYGVSESWTMLLNIDVAMLSRGTLSGFIEPAMLYECRDGRKVILFVCKAYGTLYWYDIDNNNVTRIQKSTWEKRRKPKRKRREFE